MKVGSLFAGIGGFDLGFERAGFEVAWCVEWDRHAQAVLRRRFPQATVYGDIREVDPDLLERVDVICGGFPCQDLSVAGKRAGLAGSRSGLFHEAMHIVRRLRPGLLVLENVPGLLSSNRGLDFATVIREVGEGWDCAEVGWRVLDSRYFGVAQRRRRVFVVAGSRTGCAEQILALSEGGGWDPPKKRATRKEAAGDSEEGSRAECHEGVPLHAGPIGCRIGRSHTELDGHGAYIPIPFRKSKRARSDSDDETWVEASESNTLNQFDSGERDTHAIIHAIPDIPKPPEDQVCIECGNDLSVDEMWHCMECLTSGASLTSESISYSSSVRRLTPRECERLQGFPDDWTQIGTREKPTADSHRYKQLGNAVTVNVAEWIARRAAQFIIDRRPHEGNA